LFFEDNHNATTVSFDFIDVIVMNLMAATAVIVWMDDETMKIEEASHNVQIHYVTTVVKQHND
jgi:hypothetical protein